MMEFHNIQLRKAGTYIGKYRVQYLIASGTFGKVYLATYNGKRYAIKQMAEPTKLSHKLQMENEIKVLADMNHDNIVKLYEVIRERGSVHLIMEYCQSDMREYISAKEGKFTESEAHSIIMQIINGMNELVQNHIVHRDLKPANILYAKGIFKIADFGLAKYIQDQYQMLRTRVGTPFYMAPQILKNQKYTSKCDIWSLGIIFYQLLFGILPWYATNEEQLLYSIYHVPLTFPFTISPKIKKLLRGMISIQECYRFSWDELLREINMVEQPQILYNNEMDKTFHRTTMEKLLNLELNRVSMASYGKRFDPLKIQEKKSVIGLVGKLFNEDNIDVCNSFMKLKLKI